jgi:hypothetical protein
MDRGLQSVWSGPKLILLTNFHAGRSSGLLTATVFSFGAWEQKLEQKPKPPPDQLDLATSVLIALRRERMMR